MFRNDIAKLLLDTYKIIFAIGFYGVMADVSTDKKTFATISACLCIAMIVTAFSLKKYNKEK